MCSSLSRANAGGRCGSPLRELNEQLHAMSQPMTVLLCTLSYGEGLDSVQEMREMFKASQDACERLRRNVTAMQAAVREAMEESAVAERALD